jgi:hypothetical protein
VFSENGAEKPIDESVQILGKMPSIIKKNGDESDRDQYKEGSLLGKKTVKDRDRDRGKVDGLAQEFVGHGDLVPIARITD